MISKFFPKTGDLPIFKFYQFLKTFFSLIFQISKSATPDSGPVLVNPVQSCILMWSLQHSAWEGRVGGVAYLSSAYEDPFVPQLEYKYQRTLFKAPGMRYCRFVFEIFSFNAKSFRRLLGCRIREGFLIKSIVINSKKKIFCMYMYVMCKSLSLSSLSRL